LVSPFANNEQIRRSFLAGSISSDHASRISAAEPANDHGVYGLRSKQMISKVDTGSNTQKDPDDWVSGDEPMTGAQASYLKTLCEQAHRPDVFDENLTKAEASKLIDEMRKEAGVSERR
jgi:hypothetical protein